MAEEFRRQPFGTHSPALQALLSHLRQSSNSLQLLLVQAATDRWLLAQRHPGDRPPTLLPLAPFATREAAE